VSGDVVVVRWTVPRAELDAYLQAVERSGRPGDVAVIAELLRAAE